MFLKPMRLVLALAAIACALLLSGCFDLSKGESADPPAGGLTAVAGDGSVTLSWQPDSGVHYLVFWGAGTTLDANRPRGLKVQSTSPLHVAGRAAVTTSHLQ